jgi:tRNA pseudouridine38-40 synthase
VERYFFHIAFKGINYRGWQYQPLAISVQETIETVMSKVLKERIKINGCGRTDAQVHASQYIFHADLSKEYDFDVLFRLNHALPHDIAFFEMLPVLAQSHARFDAAQRTYDYFIHTRKDPFLHGVSALYSDQALDLKSMQAAVSLLSKYDDYYAYCKSPNSFEHTICRVSSAYLWTNKVGDRLRFQITANRFLTGMIRIIVGRLLDIGRGIMSVDAFEEHLKNLVTPNDITPAYPQGLYLSKIVYPYLDLAQQTDFASVFQYEQEGYWEEISLE